MSPPVVEELQNLTENHVNLRDLTENHVNLRDLTENHVNMSQTLPDVLLHDSSYFTQSESDIHTLRTAPSTSSSATITNDVGRAHTHSLTISVPHMRNAEIALASIDNPASFDPTKCHKVTTPGGTVHNVSFFPIDTYYDTRGKRSHVMVDDLTAPRSGTVSGFGTIEDLTRTTTTREASTENDHHRLMQSLHRQTRERHFTDLVDFEGILRIIGGIGYWQFSVYFLVILAQIPHAMFNMLIIFMMIQPEHHCEIPSELANANWSYDQKMEMSIPKDPNKTGEFEFSKCEYFSEVPYELLAEMNYTDAKKEMKKYRANNITRYSQRHKCKAWQYDTQDMRETIVTQWNLVCGKNFRRADAHLAYALGYLLGCLVSGLASDRFGRKPTVIGFGVLASLFGVALAFTTHFEVFLVIRFLSAVVNEAAGLAAYVLCMEITGTRYRAHVGSMLQLPWAFGYTLLAGLAYATRDWRHVQIIVGSLHMASILLICVLPESPRWLIVNNRLPDAEAIIRTACTRNGKTLPPDLELIKHAERRELVKRNQRASLLHLIKSQELLVRTVIIFILWAVTALVYYGVSLNFSDQSTSGDNRMFNGNLFVNNAIAGAIEVPVLVICVFVLAAGRKKSQMACLILAGVMMLGVVLSPPHATWLRMTFMLVGKSAAQAAFAIIYIFTSEMYPTVIRNSVVGASSMVARIGAGMAGYLAILSDVTILSVPLIIFGVLSFVAGTLVIFLPETLNQPLPDTLKDAVELLRQDIISCQLKPGDEFEPTPITQTDGAEKGGKAGRIRPPPTRRRHAAESSVSQPVAQFNYDMNAPYMLGPRPGDSQRLIVHSDELDNLAVIPEEPTPTDHETDPSTEHSTVA